MLDTKKWKTFVYDKVFIIRKGFYNKKPDSSEGSDIPFLGATDSNNGVTSYHTIDDISNASKTGDDNNSPISDKIFPANAVCVTNNGSVGYAYYQPNEFTCSHDVNPLYRKDGIPFNHKTGLFIATVIMQDRYRWQYGRKWRPVRMVKSTINLPVLTDKYGQCIIDSKKTFSDEGYIPDWDYMEKFIERLETRERESQGSIRNTLKTENRIEKVQELNINDWKEFKIDNLFNLYNGKGITQEEIDDNQGTLNVIQSGEENNGILGYINFNYVKEMNYTYSLSPCLTVARTGSAGYVSFQRNGCVVGDSAKILILKKNNILSEYYLFVQAVMSKLRYKYSYGRKVTENKYLNETIKLPIQRDKNHKPIIDETKKYSDRGYIPDWNFMKSYINSLPYGDKI